MEQQIKTIRIFISSTFKDMHSERDYLVKYVFPELKERCIKKGLSLVEVDLRWGITEEEAEQGKVLEICLDEIENCRPFFIGILGERYGWTPENYQVPEYEKYDWLRKFEKGHSVTALEIYHGVLNKKDMKPRAFFYFRNPGFIADVPQSKQYELKAESDIAEKKLFHLKEDIKDTFKVHNIPGHVMDKYPCTYKGLKIDLHLVKESLSAELTEQDINLLKIVGEDNNIDNNEYELLNEQLKKIVEKYSYVYLEGLEDFGNEVLKNVWEAIREEHPDESIVKDPLLIEKAYHQRFMNSRTRMFVGREDILNEISDYLNDNSTFKPLVLIGEPGSGKSALMAVATRRSQDEGNHGCNVVRFIGASPSSVDIIKLVQDIIRETALHFKIALDEHRINDVKVLFEYFRELLFTISSKGKLTLFIDAVNQLLPQYDPHYLVWLPKYLPENVKIVVSSIDGEYSKNAAKYKLPIVQVGELALDNCKKIILESLKEYRKTLAEKQLEIILSKADAVKPLYLKVACEELRVFPSFELINLRIAKLPNSIAELFEQFLERLEADHDSKLVKDTLCMIENSMNGLLESELLELLKPADKEKLPLNIWAKLYRNLLPYLMNAGDDSEGLLEFFHLQLSMAVKTRYLKNEESAIYYCKKLADYGWRNYNMKNGNTLNTVLYTGIYLYKSYNEDTLNKLLHDLFTADNKLFNLYKRIAENVYDWVVNNFDFEKETIIRAVSERLGKKYSPYQFSTFLHTKGTILKDIGKMRWALEFVGISLTVMEELVNREPLVIDFRSDLAASYSLIGQIYQSMGKVENALVFFEKSLNGMLELVEDEPYRTDFRSNLATSLCYIGQIYQGIGNNVKALSYFEKALKFNEELIVLDPVTTDLKLNTATVQSFVGQIYELLDEGEKAMYFFEKCQKETEELVTIEPTRIDLKITLSVNYNNLGRIYLLLGKKEDSLAYFKKSLKVNEDLVAIAPARTDLIRDLSVSINNLGNSYLSMGESEKAHDFFEKSQQVLEELLAIEPSNTDFKKELSVKFLNVGRLFQANGETEKALLYFGKSLKSIEELVAIEPSSTDFKRRLATCQSSIGQIYELQGERVNALLFFEKQKLIIEELLVLEPTRVDFKIDLSICFNYIGKSYLMIGDREKALSYFHESLKEREELVVLDPGNSELKRELALNLSFMGQFFELMKEEGQALTMFEKQNLTLEDLVYLEPTNFDLRRELVTTQNIIGQKYEIMGEERKALILYEKQRFILEKWVTVEPLNLEFKRFLSASLYNIGKIYKTTEEVDRALMLFERQKHILEEVICTEPTMRNSFLDLSVSLSNIGQIYQLKGDSAKALTCFEKQKQILDELVLLEPSNKSFKRELSASQSYIGMIYEKMGEENKALGFFKNDLKIMENLVELEPLRVDFRRDLSESFSNIGRIYESIGDSKQGAVYFEKSLELMEIVVNIEPSNRVFQKELSTCFYNVGQIYELLEEHRKALMFYQKGQLIMEELVASNPSNINFKRDLSASFNNVGMIYESIGELMKALEFFEKSQKVRSELVAREPSRIDFRKDLSISLNNAGIIYKSIGEVEKALAVFGKSINIMEEIKAIEHSKTDVKKELSKNYNYVGKIYESIGKFEKALEFFEKSEMVRKELVASDPARTDFKRDLALSYNYIGTICQLMGDKAKSLISFEKSSTIMEEIVALDPTRTDLRDLPKTYMFVANSYRSQEEIDKALFFLKKALKVLEELITLDPAMIDINVEYAICHWEIYSVIKRDEKNIWLNKTKNIIEPLVTKGIKHAQLNQLWNYVTSEMNGLGFGNSTRISDTVESNTKKRSQALKFYQSGDYKNARQLLEELLLDNFEVFSTRMHLARLAIITDNLEGVAQQTKEVWIMRNEAKNYILARILWFKLSLDYLNSLTDNVNKGIFGKMNWLLNKNNNNDTTIHIGKLKTILQKEDAIMEWSMQPVLDHIKPQIRENQHALLSALVDAMSNKGNMEKLNDFAEWSDANPVEID